MTRRTLIECTHGLGPIAVALLLGLSANACGGKGVAGDCPDLPACGGNPVGSWKATSVCEIRESAAPQLAVPTPSAVNVPQTPALAGAPPNPNVSGDWCSGLVFLPPSAQSNGKLGGASFYAKPFASIETTVVYLANQTYNYATTGASTETTHFTRSCLNAYGYSPTCAELTEALSGQQFANYQGMKCVDTPDVGCDCSYLSIESGGPSGIWRVDGGTLIQFPDNGGAAQPADFCVQGDTLTVSGKNGAHLLASTGRRSMVMRRCPDTGCGTAETQ